MDVLIWRISHHQASHSLRKEKGAAQIDPQIVLKGIRAQTQHIAELPRRYTRIVHETINAAKAIPALLRQFGVGIQSADIAAQKLHLRTFLTKIRNRLRGCRILNQID